MQTGTANARSQYLALRRLLPSTGKTLELPLTGMTVPAHRLVGADTRARVIAEVDAMIAEGRPERRLQPVVRLLALWVRQIDRQSGVWGKSVSVRVDIGGRRN